MLYLTRNTLTVYCLWTKIKIDKILCKNMEVINMFKVTSTDKAPAAIGPYSQAIEVNGFLFASGQVPINP